MSPAEELHAEKAAKAAQAAVLRKLLIETDALPHGEWSAVHHILHAIGGGNGRSPLAFLNELARDIRSDAWLAQSGPRDDGDDDIARLRFGAFKRATLLVNLLDILTAEELSR